MSKFGGTPEEALDDSKHKDIVEGAFEPLCKALWNILSVGLRKKNFLRKYTLWNVMENFKDVSSHVTKIVSWVNKKYEFLSEPQKFQAFVCECLNIGHGTLHRWLDSFLRQKERLGKYYRETALVFQLPPQLWTNLWLIYQELVLYHFNFILRVGKEAPLRPRWPSFRV